MRSPGGIPGVFTVIISYPVSPSGRFSNRFGRPERDRPFIDIFRTHSFILCVFCVTFPHASTEATLQIKYLSFIMDNLQQNLFRHTNCYDTSTPSFQ